MRIGGRLPALLELCEISSAWAITISTARALAVSRTQECRALTPKRTHCQSTDRHPYFDLKRSVAHWQTVNLRNMSKDEFFRTLARRSREMSEERYFRAIRNLSSLLPSLRYMCSTNSACCLVRIRMHRASAGTALPRNSSLQFPYFFRATYEPNQSQGW